MCDRCGFELLKSKALMMGIIEKIQPSLERANLIITFIYDKFSMRKKHNFIFSK